MSEHQNRVCVYAPCASGGHARYAWELTTALARHADGGHRFELVSSQDLEPQFRSTEYPVHAVLPPLRGRRSYPTPLHWATSRAAHYPRRERQFLNWLRSRPDVSTVHLQEWKPWLAAPMVRAIRGMGKKVFYTVHNILPHKYPAGVPKALMNRWIRRASLACDGLFVHSDRLADELARFLGPRRPPVTVSPHGVWTVPDAGACPPLAERLAMKRLLFFGAIRRNKGLDLLLDAAGRLPGYQITIAGEPSEPDYFDAEIVPRVRALRAAGTQIDLLDRFVPDDEVGRLFATHSAVVLPYTRQFVAQSGVVFMALAYGLPVVASTAGGLRDVLGECEIGTTFETGSVDGLAEAVARLHDPALRPGLEQQIAAACRRFTWDAAAAATNAGYSTALEPGRQPEANRPSELITENNDCVLGTTPAH
jgi:glycosyltransferase involved in cell wall biosynthesis